jgi:hypothetical protein
MTRHWIPALVVVDRAGAWHRIPALLDRGDRLVAELVRRSARADLAAWSDALDLERRMGGVRWRLATGYALAALVLVGAIWVYRR